MSARLSCPPAPGPLEAFAVQFNPLLKTPAQRRGFRTYLSGLLLPRDRSKTLTALVGAAPLVQAQAAEVQRLQFFLSEAAWDAVEVNAQRLALLAAEPATAPSAAGVLVIGDTADRKEGSATDHVARQYLGSVDKVDIRRFRDGHNERWWAAELTLLGFGPGRPVRAICATTDRRELPALSTWYLPPNLPSTLAEIVRLYGLRNWIEQGYKQMKDELGWTDFMVRSNRAIRRQLVCYVVAFCWWHTASQARVSESSAPLEAGKNRQLKAPPCWPRLLRAWLTPAYWLARCWITFASTPPPAELSALNASHGVKLYLRL